MNKILFISKNFEFYKSLQETYMSLGRRCEFYHSDNIDWELVRDANKIIVDESSVADVNILNNILTEKGSNNVVLLFRGYGSELSKQFALAGAHIHFINSPLYSLVNKLEDATTIEKAYEHKTKMSTNTGRTKLLAITSAMGGTGKTTLAINLADVLSRKRKQVLVVDFSIYSDVAAKLQIQYKNSLNNFISTIIKDYGTDNIDHKIHSFKNNVFHYQKKNVNFDLLFGLTPIQAEKMTSEVVEEIIKTIQKFEYDVVIFDTSSVDSETNLALIECVDTILTVSVADVGSGWKTILQKELYECIQATEKCRLVVNRFSKKSGFSCKQLEQELQYPMIGVLPENPQLGFWSNGGKLISQSNQGSFLPYLNYIAHQIEPVFTREEIKTKKIRK
jgi:Mrp family chromosome partitioning ATPase